METLVNLIGYAGTVVGTSIALPQIAKIRKTKKADDLSWASVILYCVNCVLWFVYAYLIHSGPMIVANAIGFVISIIQVILKWKYREKNCVAKEEPL